MDNPLAGLLSMLQGGHPQQSQAPQMQPQPTPQPQQMPQQSTPMGDALGSSLRDVFAGLAMGTTPQESMAMAGRVMATRGDQRAKQQQTKAQQNKTLQWLQTQGVDAGTASYLASDPAAMRAWFAEAQKGQAPQWQIHDLDDGKYMVDMHNPERRKKISELKPTSSSSDIQEYEYAKRQGFDGSLEQWMQRKRAGAGEYGMQPIWGMGPDGRPAVLQLGKSGVAIQSKLPEGFEIARDPIRVEGPTGTTILDPQTRQQVGFIPKDVAGAAAAKERGTAQGAAQVALPTVINTAERSLALVDEMIKHPGRSTATGASGTFDPRNYFAGTDATDFRVRSEQLQGRTFLEAFQALKGGGAITEREGQAATSAVARLNTAQSDSEYLAALNELKDIISRGVKLAREKAGIPADPRPVAAGGATDLKAKYGLD